MTKYDLTKAIGDVSDELILESMNGGSNVVELHSDEVKPMRFRRHTVRKIVGVAIAACLVLTLGIAALAAADGRLTDMFENIFHYTGSEQEETLTELSADEAASCVSNGTTITPLAAVSDSSMCYISLRIDAPEGTVLALPEESGVLQLVNPDDWTDLLTEQKNGKTIYGESSSVWSDPVPGDNSLNVTILYSAQTGVSSFFASDDITVNIHNIWTQSADKGYTLFLEGDWSLDLTLQKTQPRELDVEGLAVKGLDNGAAVDWEDESITLESMSVSPLSLDVTYAYTSPDPENIIPVPGTVELVMKDGSIVETTEGNGWSSDTECGSLYIYIAPVDLEQVDYIQFGDCEIPVA